MESTSKTLIVHQNSLGYAGKISIDTTLYLQTSNKAPTEDMGTIVVIDRSGSMGSSFPYLLTEILPRVFELLNYSEKAKIDIITFESDIDHFSCSYKALSSMTQLSDGNTFMAPAVKQVSWVIYNNSFQNYRILVISDGCLFDQEETLSAGSELAAFIKKGNYKINSQAVRFFTSSAQPDTRGMASLLQLNTSHEPKLIDIDSFGQVEDIANQIASLFKEDGMDIQVKLISSQEILLDEPWSNEKKELLLETGMNLIWLRSLADFQLQLPNGEMKNVEVENGDPMSFKNYKQILGEKIETYKQKVKVLKVVNTDSSNQEMNKIVTFFNKLEAGFDAIAKESQNNSSQSLTKQANLMKQLVESRMNSISGLMSQIRDDDKVCVFNLKEQAIYLQKNKYDFNKSDSEKRADEMDKCIRKECVEMAKHFNEISDIDDSSHIISYYSTDTTFNGIKSIVALTQEEAFNYFSTIEILKIINIVGVAAKRSQGDFTDPSTFSIEAIYPGCNISISDLIVMMQSNKGNSIKVLGRDEYFNTAIPCFDNERIHRFLLKYAPKILEYYASIGMREKLLDTPRTWEHLILSGVLKMIQILLTNQSEIAVKTMHKLISSYETASGKAFSLFDELITPIKTTPEPKMNSQAEGQKDKILFDFMKECLGTFNVDLSDKADLFGKQTEKLLRQLQEKKDAQNQELANEIKELKEKFKSLKALQEDYLTLSDKYTKLLQTKESKPSNN